LPTETRLALAYRLKELEAQKAKERQLANLKQFSEKEETAEKSRSPDRLPVTYRDNTENNKTLEVIAQKAGVSHMTAFQYDKIQQQGTEEQKANTKRLKKNKCTAYFLQKCLSSKR
jgi:hypothetical protein